MKQLIVLFAILTISAAAHAQIISIVGPENCRVVGNHLMQCQYNPTQLILTPEAPYVSKTTSLQIMRQGTCATQFPININLTTSGGASVTYNALQAATHVLGQGQSSSLAVNVQAPYRNSAYFHSSCRITAAMIVNRVDISQLQMTLSGLKQITLTEITVLDDRIEDKSTIASLLEATFVLENLLAIAEQTTVDFYSLNDILLNSCESIAPCTWSDQIAIILDDPAVNMPFLQQLMLFQLGQQLDVIVPADCAANNCVAELIDDALAGVIENLRSNINLGTIDNEIQNLVAQRYILEDRLAEYRATAVKHQISWDSI